MDNERKDQNHPPPRPGFDKDQPQRSPGQRQPDRSDADDRGNRKQGPDDPNAAIPDLEEPNVEGVGNEGGKNTQATMPPGEGQQPNRHTM